MRYKLSDIAEYSNEKISSEQLSSLNYLSTENMLPNFGGTTEATSIPTVSSVTKYNPDDILLSNIRPYFKKLYYSNTIGGCSNDVLCIRPVKEKTLSKFLYYSLKHDLFFEYVMATSKGTKMPRGDKQAIMNYEINLPDLETQKKIVRILSALDNKIELNNQQNQTLMDIAIKTYRDLLDKQDDSWISGYIGDEKTTKIVKSGVHDYSGTKKYIATADVSGINITHFENVTFCDKPSRANMTPKKDTIWFAKMEGSSKNLLVADFCQELQDNYIFSTGFIGVECLQETLYYLWCYINDEKFLDIKNSLSTGTLMAGISNSTIKNAKYAVPPKETLNDFNKIAKPIFEKIYRNSMGNESLIKIRDALLPKLMNGEINLEWIK